MHVQKSHHPSIDKVKRLFAEYLGAHGLRKTPERFAILEEIYARNDHFDAESLYVHMKTHNYHVSRATVYNTLDLLCQCQLILKHHFGDHVTRYERAYGVAPHDHLICTECGRILEFSDPYIQEIRERMSRTTDFDISHHALILYGKCGKGCRPQGNGLGALR